MDAASVVYIAQPSSPRVDLPTLIARMIELFDGSRTVAAVCDEVQISVGKGVAAVRKLNARGLLRQVDPALDLGRADTLRNLAALPADLDQTCRDDEPTGFSAEEEAFFASEVTPADECDEPFLTLRDRIGVAFFGLLGCRAA